jgi:Polysaccharide deacetylase
MLRALALCLVLCATTWAADRAGTTRVAKWKGDKQAAFMLMFDDSCASHVKIAIPELVKRQMVGTFYLNPGSGHYQGLKNDWETIIPKLDMEYANHTFTHKGAKDAADLDQELVKANDVIIRIIGGPSPRLISFGRPGVKEGAWAVTPQELTDGLTKHHLIMRPNVGGRFAEINLKTGADMYAIAEKALATGGADCVVFHGVGGDWLTAPLNEYIDLLDRLVRVQDKLWIAGHIAVHCYEKERSTAKVQNGKITSKSITLKLTSDADPTLFFEPLTLITAVPSDWTQCKITQGKTSVKVLATAGLVCYDAVPNGADIVIQEGP